MEVGESLHRWKFARVYTQKSLRGFTPREVCEGLHPLKLARVYIDGSWQEFTSMEVGEGLHRWKLARVYIDGSRTRWIFFKYSRNPKLRKKRETGC